MLHKFTLFLPCMLLALIAFGQDDVPPLPAEPPAPPCACCSEPYYAFDFWRGEWEVFDPTGKLVGTNKISVQEDHCVLKEEYKTTGKFTGTSYSYYDKNTKSWYQVWIDNQGGSLKLKGGPKDGKMILSSEFKTAPNGATYFDRVTWSPQENGEVIQLWEAIDKQGNVLKEVFRGTYKSTLEDEDM